MVARRRPRRDRVSCDRAARSRIWVSLSLLAVLATAGCEDRQPAPAERVGRADPPKRPEQRASTRHGRAASPPSAKPTLALTVAPPRRCAEGGYGIWPALTHASGVIDFCLYRPRGSACRPTPQAIWEPDPLEQRPCLRFDPHTRRFTQRRDWPRRALRYPRISVVDPLRVCVAADRCSRFPSLRGLRRATLGAGGKQVAVLYEGRSRRHQIDVFALPKAVGQANERRGADVIGKLRRVARLRTPARPARVQLLGARYLAWFEAKSYGAAHIHLHALPSGKLLRSFGNGDVLTSGALLAPYAALIHVEDQRWATLSLHGGHVVIEDLASGVGRRISLATYFRHAGGDKQLRTPQLNQARLLRLKATRSKKLSGKRRSKGQGKSEVRLGVVFGDPVVGLAIVDPRRERVTDVLYAPCL
jgi:hypothetical protein